MPSRSWLAAANPQKVGAGIVQETTALQSVATEFMVISAGQVTIGSILSTTVTIAVQFEVFPFTSVTVKVTVFAPTFAQVKLDGDTDKLAMPQASLLPLSISLAVILVLPALSNVTVMFWVAAIGATLSCTVTVAVSVEVLPLLSVTVQLYVFAATFAHVKLAGDTDKLAMPQA